MRPFEFDKILEDEENFREDAKYEYFEISTVVDDPAKTEHAKGKLKSDEAVAEWIKRERPLVDDQKRPLSHLRVLIAIHPRESTWLVPCTYEVYKLLQEEWRLPERALVYLRQNTWTCAEVREPRDESVGVKRLGFVSTWVASIQSYTIHDLATRTTSVFIAAEPDDKPNLKDIRSILFARPALALMPFALPYLLTEIARSVAAAAVGRQTVDLDGTRSQLEMDPYVGTDVDEEEKREQDLLQTMRKLTTLTQAFAQDRLQTMPLMERQIAAVRKLHEQYCQTLPVAADDVNRGAADELLERLEGLQGQVEGMKWKLDVRQSDVQGLVQTVYTLVASNDNSLNYEVARASLQMAEDSNKAAVLARQDSTDMRVIAAATFIFLPGTFVATFFSTTFFNFDPPEGSMASPWIWIYFVATAVLTALVILVWRLTSRAGDKETVRLLRVKDPELLKQMIDDEKDGGVETETAAARSESTLRGIRAKLKRLKRRQAVKEQAQAQAEKKGISRQSTFRSDVDADMEEAGSGSGESSGSDSDSSEGSSRSSSARSGARASRSSR